MQHIENKILRMVVASPGDVNAERKVLPGIIDEVNRDLRGSGLQLELAMWETDAFPGFHVDGPQGLIDSVLKIEESDILIGIFWKRFGKPVKDAASGTEHEIRKAYAAWKQNGKPQIMVYFCQRPYNPQTEKETQQWGTVLKFKGDFPKEGLWWTFESTQDFEALVRNHLKAFLRDKYPRQAKLLPAAQPVTINLPPVPPGTKTTIDYSQPGKVVLTSEYLDGLPTTPNPSRRILFEKAREMEAKSEFKEAIPLFQQLLQKPETPSEELALLMLIGNCFAQVSQLEPAQKHYTEVLAKAQRLRNEEAEAAALGQLGAVFGEKGDLDKALEHHQKSFKLYEKIGDPLGQAWELSMLGAVYAHTGHLDERLEHLEKALRLFEAIGDTPNQARLLGGVSRAYLDKGDTDKALKTLQRAVRLRKRIGDTLGQAAALGQLGAVFGEKGDLDKALEHHQKALCIFEKIGARLEIERAKENIAIVEKLKAEKK